MTRRRQIPAWLIITAILGAGFLVAIANGHPESYLPEESLTGAARVIDGDTLVVNGVHIRLYGIDAPEQDQPCNDAQGFPYRCGLIATGKMQTLLSDRTVTCQPLDVDRYGRTVAACSASGVDLGDFMVRSGWAVDYTRYDADGRYKEAEDEARAAHRGIFQGPFMQPEQWRHRR